MVWISAEEEQHILNKDFWMQNCREEEKRKNIMLYEGKEEIYCGCDIGLSEMDVDDLLRWSNIEIKISKRKYTWGQQKNSYNSTCYMFLLLFFFKSEFNDSMKKCMNRFFTLHKSWLRCPIFVTWQHAHSILQDQCFVDLQYVTFQFRNLTSVYFTHKVVSKKNGYAYNAENSIFLRKHES